MMHLWPSMDYLFYLAVAIWAMFYVAEIASFWERPR